MIPHDFRRLVRLLIELKDRPILYWASLCGIHPSNAANWLRGRDTLSNENVARFLNVLSVDPDTLKLDPSRIHVWIVAIHEPETLKNAGEEFLESPSVMATVSPDPTGPSSMIQAPQIALVRSGPLRIVLLRKLFPTRMSDAPQNQKAGSPWISPSLLPGGRWKAEGVSPSEAAPPLILPGPFIFDLVLGNMSIEGFDAVLDKAAPWDWPDVIRLAGRKGLTARDVAEMIQKPRSSRN